MKNYLTKLLCLFIVLSVISCQDTIDEYANSEIEDSVKTRADQDQVNTDYYWFKDKKVPLRKVENKSFVLFKSKDESSLISALSKNKIRIDVNKIKKYDYSGTDLSGNSANTFLDFKCAEINIDVNTAYNYPEIVYAAPFFRTDVYSDEFPLTNLMYIFLKEGTDISLLEKIIEEYHIGLIGKFDNFQNLYVASCTKESQGSALEIANKLYDTKLFETIEPAFIAAKTTSPNDSLYSQQWNLENTGQYGSGYNGIDINYSQTYGTCSSNIIIGVVDSGVELTHPDLTLHSFSWNAYSATSPSVVYNAHGTNVAGILGAKTNNTIGIAGIASGAKIMSLSNNFASSGTILAQLASSIKKAVDKGASVINNSWTSVQSTAIENAISYAINNGRNGKGCILVFSSGNDNANSISYPASHTPEKEVISVGAISYDGMRKTPSSPDGENWGSNYGTNLDVVAPGVKIPTTTINGSYRTNFNGTSAAAPHVSGVAALVINKNSALNYEEIGYIIERTAQKLSNYSFSTTSKFGGTWNSEVGHGLLNMQSAVQLAQSTAGSSGNISINGQTNLTADSNGYAYTTLTVSPSNTNYTYIWSGQFNGEYDRWYIWPSGNGYGNTADISIYLNPMDSGGTLAITCMVFNGINYIGTGSTYLYVTP